MRATHNRSVLAARAANRPGASRSTRPSTNLTARAQTVVTETGHVKRSSAVPMTGAQTDSQGNRSAWNDSTEFFVCPKWDQTVSSQRVGGQ